MTQTGTAIPPNYRLDGIYPQRQAGFFMLRVKLTAGIISAEQARTVAATAERYGKGTIHLTTRGSMEIHWLHEADLPAVKRELAATGLTSRGACGGAVRGVTCATQGSAGFPAVEKIARRIHRHFTGNPRFERLPKKFKIGIEADTHSKRHLIQDVGLVLAAEDDGTAFFDVYVAGGLGREPQSGFLLEAAVEENRIIPLLEAIARVYAAGAPAGKRLKHLILNIGETEFRSRLAADPGMTEVLPPVSGLTESFVAPTPAERRITARIPAGELSSSQLGALARIADDSAGSLLIATAEQDIAFHLHDQAAPADIVNLLGSLGFSTVGTIFRICPGTATCSVGLSATRSVAERLQGLMGTAGSQLTWAISGCPNSCSQPQLADVGIVTSALRKVDNNEREPLFDLYRGEAATFGTLTDKALTLDQLCDRVQEIS